MKPGDWVWVTEQDGACKTGRYYLRDTGGYIIPPYRRLGFWHIRQDSFGGFGLTLVELFQKLEDIEYDDPNYIHMLEQLVAEGSIKP